MAESFVERRRRELGLAPLTTNSPAQVHTSTTKTADKPKESDFVTRRKIELGLLPDPKVELGKKQAESFKQAEQQFNPLLHTPSQPFVKPTTYSDFSADPTKLPMVQAANKYADDNPTWGGIIDNPIGRTVGKGLGAVGNVIDKVSHLPVINQVTGAMQGGNEPLYRTDAKAEKEPLWKKYLESVRDVTNLAIKVLPGGNAALNVIPSKTDKSGIDLIKNLSQVPKGAIQGALHPDAARKKLSDTLQPYSPATKMIAESVADPLSYVPMPSIKGIKSVASAFRKAPIIDDGLKIGDVVRHSSPESRVLSPNKKIAEIRPDTEFGGQYKEYRFEGEDKWYHDTFIQDAAEGAAATHVGHSGPILGLPEPKSAIMAREAERRSVLEPSNKTVLGRGEVATLGLPESNTPRIVSDIKKQAAEYIKPPTSRRDLILYAEKHIGVPRAEIIKLNDDELYKMGQMIRAGTDMEALHTKLAAEQGLNWGELVSGKSVTGNVEAPLNRIKDVRPPSESRTLIGSKQGEEIAATREVKAQPTTLPKPKKETIKGAAAKTEVIKPAKVEVISKPNPLKAKAEAQRTVTPDQKVAGIRANYQNQLKNGNLSPKLKDMIKNTDQSYEKITNKASDEVAQEAVKNLSKAESDFLLNQSGGPDHIATGYRLQQKLDAMGEHARALVVSNKLAKDLTKSGQTSQAARIISRLSPEGQLLNLIRTAEKNGKVVSVADSVEFKAQARKATEKAGAGIQANQFTEILDRAAKGEKLTPDDVKKMGDYLANAEKNAKPKAPKVADDLPAEFKDVRKRDKIVSFLDDAEQAALARIKARKNNLNSLPIGEWADHAIVASAQIAKGTIKAATHVEDLVKLFGEEVRPVATQIFQKAQSLVKRVSPSVGGGDISKAKQAFRRLSGAAEKEKAAVQEMALHVKKLIADSKAGKLAAEDIQKLRDYSDEIAEMTDDLKPRELPTQDQRFLQSVKTLLKKIAQIENEKIPMDQANKDITNILRQITKISEEGTEQALRVKVDNTHLSDIAHDVMNKTRPNPKPVTLQEKIVEKYLKEQEKAGIIVNPKDIVTLRELAKNVTRLSGSEGVEADIAMQKILNSYEKSSAWDKIQASRYIAMLLNTSTQLVNAGSGPLMATVGHVADVFGTTLDITMSKLLNKPRTTTLYGTNPLKFITRYIKAAKIGGKAGAIGVNPAGIQSTNEIRGLAFTSLYNPLGLAERGLGAVAKGADYAAYTAVYKSEMEKQGFLSAINSGIKRGDKRAVKAHIENFINDPPEAAMLQADRIGKNTTFQRSDSLGGKVANHLNSSPPLVKPFVNAIVPFVRTPINMASSAVTMTPAGIIKGLFQLTSKSKATQREAIRTLSLGITGSGISAVGLYLFNIGIITGANDSGNKDVDAIREQAGRGKYRFNQSALKRYLSAMLDGDGSEAAEAAAKYREGDHAFDYNKFQPLAFPFAIGASLAQNKNKPFIDKIASAGTDAYGSLFGMSTLKGVQTVFQPSYGGTQGDKALGPLKRVEESFLKSFSWGGLAQEARRQDPIARVTPYNDGVIVDTKDYFKSRIPGLSQSLPASKTTLGMNKMNAAGFGGQYVNPYKSEIAAYSNAAVIIADLIDRTGDESLAPKAPDKKVEGKDKKTGEQVSLPIPQDRYEQLQEEVGHEIILQITALDPSLKDADKAEKIKDIYAKARKKEMDKVKDEFGIRK